MSDNKQNNVKRPGPGRKDSSAKAAGVPQAPHPQFGTVIELEKALEAKFNEENLAKAVGICWNKYAWYEEHEDPSAGDELYRQTCEQTDSWCEAYYRTVDKLKTFLGYDADTAFALPEIAAVMDRNGFEDKDGVWQRKKKQ